ncbi:type II secretion system F family protein [Stieleria varia]|uniref:Type II secretion system protein F n=1 Tax=Stieleria varia TaxID=2528005 RepID=A0A5C6AG64_9BACT|nr:type II secretion system F family protein [Stieleria varia]TWT98396.1 Type II secretion system protein F [Stieleria varia]
MAVFSYTGVDPSRQTIKGTIAADTPRQARDLLRMQGVQVRKLVPCVEKDSRRWSSRFSLSSTASQWTTVVHEMSMLLSAGIPILDALDTIAQQHTGTFRAAILGVHDRVAAGASLADALAERPDLFDAASVHMVAVGENSGTLDSVLQQLAEFKQRQMRFRDAVTTALIYPLFLVCFGTAAAVFLMTSVLPPLLENLQETLTELPWPTRVAKAISDVLLGYRWWLLAGAGVGAVGLYLVLRSERGKELCHSAVLRLPVVGSMSIKQNVSRIATIIGTLTRSGVDLPRAVDLAGQSIGNRVFKRALGECGERISAGVEIADAMASTGVFPPLAVRVFSVGQDSGKLDEMLFRLADDYDGQVATTSERLTSLLEPVLILVLAALVGFLLLATILPILEAGNVM